MEQCPEHTKMVSDITKLSGKIDGLTKAWDRVEKTFTLHIVEGDKPGGYRDRLLISEQQAKEMEKEIKAVRNSLWRVCLVSGLIGGLVGKLTPELFNLLIKFAFAGQ